MVEAPVVTMKTVQVSANLLFEKMMGNLTLWLVLIGLVMICFVSFWYLKVRKR